MINIKAEILYQIPIDTLLQHFGLTPQHGFIRCPFHQDDTASCRIYKNTNTFFCFGCKKGGNVIDFAMGMYNLGFMDTLRRLNDDFHLDVFATKRKRTMRERIDADKRARDYARTRSEKETKRKLVFIAYWYAFDVWRALCRCKEIFAPKTPDEDLHPMFVHALLFLDLAEFNLANAESEVIALETG